MSHVDSSSGVPQGASNRWLLRAQLAASLLLGSLLAVLSSVPHNEDRPGAQSSAPRAGLAAISGPASRNVSSGSLRQVRPVELRRESAYSTESPRHVDEPQDTQATTKVAAPQIEATSPPPVRVQPADVNDSKPNSSDLVANAPANALAETAVPSPGAASEATGEPSDSPTTGEPAAAANVEPNDGREPQSGENVKQAPESHKDPSVQDMNEVGQREAAEKDDATAPIKARRELTAEQLALRDKLKTCLGYYYQEPISVGDYSPWGIMHALIAYGVDTNVYANSQSVNAIGWVCYNGRCRGQRLFELNQQGKIVPLIGVGVQGHPGQYLSMLAQSRVRTDYPLKIEGHDFTVADLIAREQETCRVKTELTFKLIGLVHYLDTDTKWKNDLGEEWDLPKMIKEELAAPIIGAACGGTHRMTGFSYSVNKRRKEGKPFDGQWARAKKYVEDYHEYIFRLQNEDGSFSSNWFAGRGDWGGATRKVETTGHMTEWLVASCTEEQLADPRVVKALNLLTDTFLAGRGHKWEIGPRGHGLHALVIYDERVYGAKPGERRLQLARKPNSESE